MNWREFAWQDFAWRDFSWWDFYLAGNCLEGKGLAGICTGGIFFSGNLNRREFELAGKLRHTEYLTFKVPDHMGQFKNSLD